MPVKNTTYKQALRLLNKFESRTVSNRFSCMEALAAVAEHNQHKRFYIAFSYVDPICLGGIDARWYTKMLWRKGVWPKLFPTYDAAMAFAKTMGAFKNAAAIPGVRGKLKSFTVESVYLKDDVPVLGPLMGI